MCLCSVLLALNQLPLCSLTLRSLLSTLGALPLQGSNRAHEKERLYDTMAFGKDTAAAKAVRPLPARVVVYSEVVETHLAFTVMV